MLFFSVQEVSEPNRASIYKSLTINISKEMMCFSDFPIPADYPNYMHHSRILQYFRLYTEHFKLLQHIRFQVTEQLSAGLQLKIYILDLNVTCVRADSTILFCCVSDQCSQREAKAWLLSLRAVGGGDGESRRAGGEAHLWCCDRLFWTLFVSLHASKRLPRLQDCAIAVDIWKWGV